MQNNTLVLIGGYARTGKSTLETQLKLKGFTVLSTSLELDYITCELFNLPRYCITYLQSKDDSFFKNILGNDSYSARELKIMAAERITVPRYGREYIVNRTFYNQLPYSNVKDNLVFMTSIGGDEASIANSIALSKGLALHQPINLVRDSGLPGIDSRLPLQGALTFSNHFHSASELVDAFLKVFKV